LYNEARDISFIEIIGEKYKLRKITVGDIEPGMQLSRPAQARTGAVLLEAGALLNSDHIEKLRMWDVDAIYIIDTSTPDEQIEEQERILTEEFKETHSKAMDFTKQFIEKAATGETPRDTNVENHVVELMEKLLINKDILFKLTGIYSVDNYLYAHSVNVAVLSLLLGVNLGIERESLIDLGSAALLADIGMSLIPVSVYDHDGPLTDEQRAAIRRHPIHSVEILQRIPGIGASVLEAVRQHHERMDGKGYPENLAGEQICRFARIIAVADVYAAIREPRTHRVRSAPRRALKALTDDHGFDPEILRMTLATISIYPVQSVVHLNNNWTGTVVSVAHNNPFRPTIKLLKDESGRPVTSAKRIDLSQETNFNLYIEEVIDVLPTEQEIQ
jgi:HD-GYP domain-containing protein (c-di-GMP phosphodiesterase class II)